MSRDAVQTNPHPSPGPARTRLKSVSFARFGRAPDAAAAGAHYITRMTDSIDVALTDAALALAAEDRWAEAGLRDLAARAGVAMPDLYGRYRSKLDVLEPLSARFDAAAARDFEHEPGAGARERVFEAAMARFDAMEPHRAGVAPIMRSALQDPASAMRAYRATQRSARWLLELAGLDTAGLRGAARVQGFAPVLARAARAWLTDDAGDLSKTMRALDRDLREIEETLRRAGRFWRRGRGRDETDADGSEAAPEPPAPIPPGPLADPR